MVDAQDTTGIVQVLPRFSRRGDHMYRKKRKGWKSWLFTGEEMVDLQPPWISFNPVEGRRDDGWMELGRNWVAAASANSDSRRCSLPKKRWGVVVGDSGGWSHQLS